VLKEFSAILHFALWIWLHAFFPAREDFAQALFCARLARRVHSCQVLIALLAAQGLAFSLPFIFPPVFAELGLFPALPFFGRQSTPLSFFTPTASFGLPLSIGRDPGPSRVHHHSQGLESLCCVSDFF
jgi:hypothetical protein